MKKDEQDLPILSKIVSLKDNLNNYKKDSLNNITLMHMKNKVKDTIDPLKRKIRKYSKKINNKLKYILNTSDIIDDAKEKSSTLKNIIYELDGLHKNNMSKFKELSNETDELKHLYLNMKKFEKEEGEKNDISTNYKNTTATNFTQMKDNVKEEMNLEKMYKLLSDNILLMPKKKDIYSYYLIKNKYNTFNDEKKIRYMDKIKELLEIKQIQVNKLLDEKEKKAKIENNKFFINQKKRLKKEKHELYNKMAEKLRQENELSLRNIKETNATLTSIKNNKSYLDEEIKLKYDHSNLSSINSNINNNFKKKIIRRITKIHPCKNERSRIDNTEISMGNTSDINLSKINNYKDLLNQYKNKNTGNINRKKTLINIKRLICRKNGPFISKNVLKKKMRKKTDVESKISEDEMNKILDNDKLAKAKMKSVYEEIKSNSVLLKKDEDFVRNFFIRKKFFLSKRPKEAIIVMSNSLSRINETDITKKLKKIHGVHIPEKYSKYFDRIESINKGANDMKSTIFDRLCKSQINY